MYSQADLVTVTDAECQANYTDLYLIPEHSLCAFSADGSTCHGDSGGYVGHQATERYHQDCIVSFVSGITCTATPVGCTEVYPYLDWIETYVDGLHFWVDKDATTTLTPPTTIPPPNNTDSNICGIKGNLINRIIGGEIADENEWPWQAALVITSKSHFVQL